MRELQYRILNWFKQSISKLKNQKRRPIHWYHSRADLIWPVGPFNPPYLHLKKCYRGFNTCIMYAWLKPCYVIKNQWDWVSTRNWIGPTLETTSDGDLREYEYTIHNDCERRGEPSLLQAGVLYIPLLTRLHSDSTPVCWSNLYLVCGSTASRVEIRSEKIDEIYITRIHGPGGGVRGCAVH